MNVPRFADDGSGWRQVSGDPIDLPAEVFAKADEFFDKAEDGTIDLSDTVSVDELIAHIRSRHRPSVPQEHT